VQLRRCGSGAAEAWAEWNGYDRGAPCLPALPPCVQRLVSEWPLLRDTFLILDANGWRLPRVNETCCARPSLAKLLRDGRWLAVACLVSPAPACTMRWGGHCLRAPRDAASLLVVPYSCTML
jgi:hypothetical protein